MRLRIEDDDLHPLDFELTAEQRKQFLWVIRKGADCEMPISYDILEALYG